MKYFTNVYSNSSSQHGLGVRERDLRRRLFFFPPFGAEVGALGERTFGE